MLGKKCITPMRTMAVEYDIVGQTKQFSICGHFISYRLIHGTTRINTSRSQSGRLFRLVFLMLVVVVAVVDFLCSFAGLCRFSACCYCCCGTFHSVSRRKLHYKMISMKIWLAVAYV